MKPGQKGNPLFAENLYSLEDPDFKYQYGMELACNGNIFRPPAFPLKAGFTVFISDT